MNRKTAFVMISGLVSAAYSAWVHAGEPWDRGAFLPIVTGVMVCAAGMLPQLRCDSPKRIPKDDA